MKFVKALTVFGTAAALACGGSDHPPGEQVLSPVAAAEVAEPQPGAGELTVSLDRLPDYVAAAAVAAVPGLELEGAETETEDGIAHYDVIGTVDGRAYEVEVATDGTVIAVDEGDDNADDDEGGPDADGNGNG